MLTDDFVRGNLTSVKLLIGVGVLAQRPAIHKNPGKESVRARITKNVRMLEQIGIRLDITALRASRNRGIITECDLVFQQ